MNSSKIANGSVLPQHTGKMVLNGIMRDKPVQKLAWSSNNFKSYQQKLKHLLENGSNDKNEDDDPYAFQEPETALTNSQYIRHDELVEKPLIKCGQTPSMQGSLLLNQRKSHVPLYTSSPPIPTTIASVPIKQPTVLKQPQKLVKSLTPPVTPNRPVKSVTGKPLNVGKSLMSKLAIAKIEKAIEGKNKGGLRSKPLNALHKTASLSRLVSKPKRVPPIRSASLDCDLAVNKLKFSNSARKTSQDDFLLGSHIGVESDCVEMNVVKNKSAEAIQIQTARPTVPTIPKPTRQLQQNLSEKLFKHESLQRIWTVGNEIKRIKENNLDFGLLIKDGESLKDDLDEDCTTMSQKYWFSICNDNAAVGSSKREAKLAAFRSELRHKVQQIMWRNEDDSRSKMVQVLVKSARNQPNFTGLLLRINDRSRIIRHRRARLEETELVSDELHHQSTKCPYEALSDTAGTTSPCGLTCVPFAGFCERHILNNSRQLMFSGACTALIPPHNNTCGMPLLLKKTVQNNPFTTPSSSSSLSFSDNMCQLHIRLQEDLFGPRTQKTSSHSRKRSRTSLGSGRSRKRKRHNVKDKKDGSKTDEWIELIDVNKSWSLKNDAASTTITSGLNVNDQQERILMEKGNLENGVLSGGREEDDAEVEEEELELQAVVAANVMADVTGLLEDQDLLAHIAPEAFTDLFREDIKEEFVLTAQETEELERALEAVDVKSLLEVETAAAAVAATLQTTDTSNLPATAAAASVYYNGHGLEHLLHNHHHTSNIPSDTATTSTLLHSLAVSPPLTFPPIPIISPQPISTVAAVPADVIQS